MPCKNANMVCKRQPRSRPTQKEHSHQRILPTYILHMGYYMRPRLLIMLTCVRHTLCICIFLVYYALICTGADKQTHTHTHTHVHSIYYSLTHTLNTLLTNTYRCAPTNRQTCTLLSGRSSLWARSCMTAVSGNWHEAYTRCNSCCCASVSCSWETITLESTPSLHSEEESAGGWLCGRCACECACVWVCVYVCRMWVGVGVGVGVGGCGSELSSTLQHIKSPWQPGTMQIYITSYINVAFKYSPPEIQNYLIRNRFAPNVVFHYSFIIMGLA